MNSYINQLQPPYHYQEEEEENRDNCRTKGAAIKEPDQETFPSYYHHQFAQPQDFRPKPINAQEGFDFASPEKRPRAKKRKAEAIEVVNGGRIVRPTDKKDRHSKVCTARGQRDRRLRLSPRTAIQFYDVQDRLGFDRPSKAIDWLINEAKAAIDALDHDQPPLNQFSVNSECGNDKIGHSNDVDVDVDIDTVSGFSFLLHSPSSSELQQAHQGPDFNPSRNRGEAEDALLSPGYQQGFCSSNSLQTIFDTSWEMDRLQKWDCDNGNPGNARRERGAEWSSALGYSEMSSQRETLQSSIISNSPGFCFSNELSSITAAATVRDDEFKDEKPLSVPHYDYEG